MSAIARVLCNVAALLICAKVGLAQLPAASGPAPKEDTYRGMTLNTSFDGSFDTGSKVFDWTTTTGYVFNQHFAVNAGVPILFVRGTSSTGSTTSSNGLGDAFGQFVFSLKNPAVNYGSSLTFSLPTGDSSKGLTTGRVTFDWSNAFAREFGRFTPFVNLGAGNSLADTKYWHRPFVTLGDVAHFEGGTAFDLGHSLTLSGSLYDVAPWGAQKVYSRTVTRAGGGTTGNGPGNSKHGRVFQDSAVTIGNSSIDRDNGVNADLDFNPIKYMDFDLAYSHSVHYQLDTISFGVTFNLTPLLAKRQAH
ncbi:MAG TPA: hypothetical protein VKT53_03140 [Candidatus Acidoferrum sp.]|nr:hypothetical protein [Candidatus Acidoferrum sp.]